MQSAQIWADDHAEGDLTTKHTKKHEKHENDQADDNAEGEGRGDGECGRWWGF